MKGDDVIIRRRRTQTQPMVRINLWIPNYQLKLLDQTAEQAITTRSELIRTTIMWYLKPQNRRSDQTEQDYILDTLEHRRAIREMNKAPKNFNMNE